MRKRSFLSTRYLLALERKAMILVCSRILRGCAASGRIYARRVEMVTRMLSIEKKLKCPRTRHYTTIGSVHTLSMRLYHKLSCPSLRAMWIILLGLHKVEPSPSLNQASYRSVNERRITRLRTFHLVSLMDSGKRGAKKGCSRTLDNLMIDRIVPKDCHRGNRNMSMEWVDVKKAYNSVDDKWLCDIMEGYRSPYWLCRLIRHKVETPR